MVVCFDETFDPVPPPPVETQASSQRLNGSDEWGPKGFLDGPLSQYVLHITGNSPGQRKHGVTNKGRFPPVPIEDVRFRLPFAEGSSKQLGKVFMVHTYIGALISSKKFNLTHCFFIYYAALNQNLLFFCCYSRQNLIFSAILDK